MSCRIPRDIYDRFQMVNETEGKSFADILKIGLGVLEVKVAKQKEVRQQGYSEGVQKRIRRRRAKV